MRRTVLLIGILGATLTGGAQAQGRLQVGLFLTPSQTEGGPPTPRVRTSHLTGDSRWLEVLNDQIPVRLRFRLELWRSRALNDALDRAFQWEALLRYEPLFEQYSLTIINRGRVTEERRAATVADLDTLLQAGIQVLLLPRQTGNFYFTVTLTITPLSDSELSDYERLLQGDQGPPTGAGSSSIGRRIRRSFLNLSGLRSIQLEDRTETFNVTVIPPR